MKLKQVAKKILGYSNTKITRGDEDPKKYSKALKDLIEYYPELEDKKLIITKENKDNPFDPMVKKIVDGYDLVNFEIDKYGDDNVKEYPSAPLSSGDAIKYKPFPDCTKKIIATALSNNLNIYPSTIGSQRARQDLVDYLKREGFPNKKNEYCDEINVHNVAFCASTTQAFSMIIKVIARPGDVIIIPAPTYGIFATIAEKEGVHQEVIKLRKENDYFVSAEELSEKIDSINKKLKEKGSKKYGYIPKVAAYLNINPHNPIGNVMTHDNLDIITKIGDICLEKGVFIIDDLIYRDLTYNQNKLAYPIASIPKYFNTTISLFGVSKSYGLASIRAGFIVMPTPVFWGFATGIFDLMDSMGVLQVEAVRGAFNGTDKRYKHNKEYFDKLIPIYLYQLDLVNALIYGIDSIKNPYNKKKIINDIKEYSKEEKVQKQILQGIENVSISEKTYPQSGFFIIADFTKLKGKYYKGNKIETEYDLLKAMYNFGKVRYLMGENFMWPNEDEFVARINFAIDKKALIHNFYQINRLVKELKDEAPKKNNI